jgi:chromosome segregation ATPase
MERVLESNSGLVVAISKMERESEQKDVLIDTLRNDIAAASERGGEEEDNLKESIADCEDQILDLVNQLAVSKNDFATLKQSFDDTVRDLIQTRKEADEAARRVEMIAQKISQANDALSTAVQSAMSAKKEALFWKQKYASDIRAVTERITKIHTDNNELGLC